VGEVLRAAVEQVRGLTPDVQKTADVGRERSSDLAVLTA
jgi:hypothetical protein